MRLLLAAINCAKGELATNLASHTATLRAAADAACDLAVFPEFSLTGSVDPTAHPEHAVAVDHDSVAQLVAATGEIGVGAVFGIAERAGSDFFITQCVALGGALVGRQRKRHLGNDEVGYGVSGETFVFDIGATRLGIIICAEAHPDFTWDATAGAGAHVVCFCAAPGLYDRREDDDAWRAGIEWWAESGLRDARRNAERTGVWVAMATQAGMTIDEDFPGLAALVDPTGVVLDRLPDWKPGTLIVDIPA